MLQKYEKPRENGNLLPVFREHFKTTSKIVKDKSNRVGLHAKIAESLPVFCKDSTIKAQKFSTSINNNNKSNLFVF